MALTVPVYDLKGEKVDEIALPEPFEVPVFPELIRRAYHLQATHSLQPKGVDPLAGRRTSAESRGTGLGIARIARVKGSGFARAGQAAGRASVVKGPQAHPPRPDKRIHKKVNERERRLALASALAATTRPELVRERGHRVPSDLTLPLVVSDELEGLSKASEVIKALEALRLGEELRRCREGRKRRSGTAERRGRVHYEPRGPLLVTSAKASVWEAARNIPGLDCRPVAALGLLDLAPGGRPGRLVIFTRSALQQLPASLRERALEALKVRALAAAPGRG
jgi:large subunit ribosomal protein L4e